MKFPRTSPPHKENKTSRHAIALGEVQRFCCSQGFERSRPRRPTKHLCDPLVWPEQKLGVGVGDEDHRGPDEALIPAAVVPGVVSFPCCLACSCQPGFLFTSACWVQRSSFSRRPPGVRWPWGVTSAVLQSAETTALLTVHTTSHGTIVPDEKEVTSALTAFIRD